VWVREGPSVSEKKVGYKVKGTTVVGRLWDGWIALEEEAGFMLVDGAIVGLPRLLSECAKSDHDARVRKKDEEAATFRRKVREIADRVQKPGQSTARVRRLVAEQLVVAEVTAAHHKASRRPSLLRPVEHERSLKLVASSTMSGGGLSRLLERRKIAVVDDFFHDAEVRGARRALLRLDQEGKLQQTVQALSQTRDDRVAFLESLDDDDDDARAVVDVQRGLAHALGRWRGRALSPSKSVMAAVYGEGGHYKRHRDNDVERDTGVPQNPRALTVIFYATPEDWDDDHDGGHLRFYPHDDGWKSNGGLLGDKDDDDDGRRSLGGKGKKINNNNNQAANNSEAEEPYIDVAPRPGRLVVFDSFFGHEVLPPRRDRSALTFWIYADYSDLDRPPKADGRGAD